MILKICCFYVLVRYLAEPCRTSTKPQFTNKYVAQPLSESQVLLVWNKPLGPGYKYRIQVNISNIILKEIRGTLGFGSIQTVVVNGLLPNTEYSITAQHECESNPDVYSKVKTQLAKTYASGKSLQLRFTTKVTTKVV